MVLYSRQNPYRKDRFKLITTVEKTSGNQLYVYKTPANKLAEKFLLSIIDKYDYLNHQKLPFIVNKPKRLGNCRIRFDYIDGKTLWFLLDLAIREKKKKRVREIFNLYFQLLDGIPHTAMPLTKSFSKFFGRTKAEEEMSFDCLKVGLLDLNLDNIIVSKKKYYLIDYEWTFRFSIPIKYILFRALHYTFATKPKINQIISYKDILSYFKIDKKEAQLFLHWEYTFQKSIYRNSRESLGSFKDHQKFYKNMRSTKKFHTTNTLRDMRSEIQGKTEAVNDLSKTINNLSKTVNNLSKTVNNLSKEMRQRETSLHQMIQQRNYEIKKINSDYLEFQGFKGGLIWKTLTNYRRLKKLLVLVPKKVYSNLRTHGLLVTIKKSLTGLRRWRDYIQEPVDVMDLNRQYALWLKKNESKFSKLIKYEDKLKEFKYQPLISIIMPVYNTDQKWLKIVIDSVRNQIYQNWELCIADDASTNPHIRKVLENYRKKDQRIKVVYRKKNGHICKASNTALKISTGEFIALLDHDDELRSYALFKVVDLLNKNSEVDMIYSDEDKAELDGTLVEPHFKPDWSPDMFLSLMYTCHLGIYRKKIIDKIGGFRPGYEGSQDYDLVLRLTEKTDKIFHIPEILYTWRKIPGSTAVEGPKAKPYAYRASRKALQDTLGRRGIKGVVEKGKSSGLYRIKYKIRGNPLVSIIIPTKDKVSYLKCCIRSIHKRTAYNNYEIIIIDTGSQKKETLNYYKKLKNNSNIRFLKWKKEFNFAAVNNFGVKVTKGKYILFLNNDTEVINSEWLEAMLEHAQRKEVGAVGAKLLFKDGSIQHCGIVLGLGSDRVAGHAFIHQRDFGYFGYPHILRNYSAVTAACMLLSRKKFEEVGGFGEEFKTCYNDVDLCLKLRNKGYLVVYTPYAQLYHFESISLGKVEEGKRTIDKKETALMKEKWGDLLLNDPYYNPNLTLDKNDFSLKL